jgi:uncharacterized protein YndB with AHSA1/START domain
MKTHFSFFIAFLGSMVTHPNTTGQYAKQDLTVTRTFNAPVERLWAAWSESEQVTRWWGPEGFTAPLARMDFREGGTSLVCMASPQFGKLFNTWTYREIVPLKRIEFIQNFADSTGKRINPADIGLPPDVPQDVRNVVIFERINDRQTKLTVTEYGYASPQTLELSKTGLEQCLNKMAQSLNQP